MARNPKKQMDHYNITVPRALGRRLDAELAKARAAVPLMYISKSAFFSHIMAEWISLLDDPHRNPTLPEGTRVRTRPAVQPARRTAPETRKRIRAGEGVASIPA